MTTIVVATGSERESEDYIQPLIKRGADIRIALPADLPQVKDSLAGAGGLLLTGGADIDPNYYGESISPESGTRPQSGRDEFELQLLHNALDLNMPVFAICRGMQLLNVAFGGALIQDIPGHKTHEPASNAVKPVFHQAYVSPGSKLGAILGVGMFYKVNSYHHQGLKEPQKASRLLGSAYHPDDGIIEGLESPEHSWVIGVQSHPEYEDQLPKCFANLWEGFLQWSGRFEESGHLYASS